MTTTKKAPAKKAAAVKKAAPRADQVKAADVAGQVLAAVRKHGAEGGVAVGQLAEATGIRTRVLTNVLWHLAGKPGAKTETEAQIKNVSDNRTARWQAVS